MKCFHAGYLFPFLLVPTIIFVFFRPCAVVQVPRSLHSEHPSICKLLNTGHCITVHCTSVHCTTFYLTLDTHYSPIPISTLHYRPLALQASLKNGGVHINVPNSKLYDRINKDLVFFLSLIVTSFYLANG